MEFSFSITSDAKIVTARESSVLRDAINVNNDETKPDDLMPSNPCVLCLTEEKRLACIPCGHLATCVPCGPSLRSCPICRKEINAFVKVYT